MTSSHLNYQTQGSKKWHRIPLSLEHGHSTHDATNNSFSLTTSHDLHYNILIFHEIPLTPNSGQDPSWVLAHLNNNIQLLTPSFKRKCLQGLTSLLLDIQCKLFHSQQQHAICLPDICTVYPCNKLIHVTCLTCQNCPYISISIEFST